LNYPSPSVHQAINIERQKANLPALVYSKKIEESAYHRYLEIVKTGKLEHGTKWSTEIKSKHPNWKFVGENLAQGQTSTKQLVEDWMESPLHRENILNKDYRETGIYVGKDRDRIIVVQQFLK
jgi:uncharacterized protein YkwD